MAEWIGYIRFEPLTYFFRGITCLGNQEFLYVLLPILYWCWRKRSGAYLMILVILSLYLNSILKGIFAWERPPTELWLINAHGYTFPSSHACDAVVLWGFLAYEIRKKWFAIFCIVLIMLVSFSRVYLGVHYPRDVLAGMAVGAILLHLFRWSIYWFKKPVAHLNDLAKILVILIISIAMLITGGGNLLATGAGLFAGISIGFIIEPHFADFTAEDTLLRKVIKAVLALIILLAVWQGLEWLLPESSAFKWFEYFIVGIWITAATPWYLVQLRLAHRE